QDEYEYESRVVVVVETWSGPQRGQCARESGEHEQGDRHRRERKGWTLDRSPGPAARDAQNDSDRATAHQARSILWRRTTEHAPRPIISPISENPHPRASAWPSHPVISKLRGASTR